MRKAMRNRFMRLRRQKGSALLVSLMIMVGLSLLGLGFVAISETESAIATNERNYVQAQAAAETGTKTVIQMFQNANWAQTEGILPPNNPTFKIERCHDTGCGSADFYKPTSSDELFDAPFKGANGNKFYGDIDSPDVWIRRDGGAGTTYLDALSSKLFYTPANAIEKIRISEIRVYSPPWPGATKIGVDEATFTVKDVNGSSTPTATNGWYSSANARYGVATIRVTAQKVVGNPPQVRAERSVKAIIAETPFPTVDGAIETSGSLVGQGNFNVYWGKILSEKDMQVNRPAVGLPWFDAKNVMPFEYGYDSVSQVLPGTAYSTLGTRVGAPDTCVSTVDSNLGKFSYKLVGAGNTATPVDCTNWTSHETLGTTFVDGTATWKVDYGVSYRLDSSIADATTKFYQDNPWFYQLVGRTFEDPWLHARARNTLVYNNSKIVPCSDAVSPHPCDYNATNWDPTQRYSNFFQNQFANDPSSGSYGTADYPERLEAVFPTMDYEFWKSIAQSSSNQPGTSIYYFQYAGSANNFIGPNGVTKDIVSWLNAAPNAAGKPYNGLGAGFYFFDSANGKNPQFNKGGTLTPTITLNSGSIPDPKFQIRGYVYLNAVAFGSSGVGNSAITDLYPMPPEPYRDVGYRKVCRKSEAPCPVGTGGSTVPYGAFLLQGGTTDPPTLPTANYIIDNANNGEWNYEDVNENGQFDIYVTDITKGGAVVIKRPDGNQLPTPTYVPVPYFDGCTVPDPIGPPVVVPAAGTGCSEPHEPFLNITYPTSGNPAGTLKVEWYDPTVAGSAAYRRPKIRTGVNTGVTCTDTSTPDECTSDGYDSTGADAKGALVSLPALAWGAIYNEGGYSGSGNADYYGALLMRGSFNATGTPNVWFDACLATGCLETQLRMQRVMVTSLDTD